MNSVDIGRCRKRIVQYIWDPEPRNDEEPDASIWCLGVEYAPQPQKITANTTPGKLGNCTTITIHKGERPLIYMDE